MFYHFVSYMIRIVKNVVFEDIHTVNSSNEFNSTNYNLKNAVFTWKKNKKQDNL